MSFLVRKDDLSKWNRPITSHQLFRFQFTVLLSKNLYILSIVFKSSLNLQKGTFSGYKKKLFALYSKKSILFLVDLRNAIS